MLLGLATSPLTASGFGARRRIEGGGLPALFFRDLCALAALFGLARGSLDGPRTPAPVCETAPAFATLGPCDRAGKSRLRDSTPSTIPTLVVQRENDPFGTPPGSSNRTVVRVPGTHSLRSSAAVAAAVSEWLTTLLTGLAVATIGA